DPGPSQERLPQHGADPRVLERGAREAGRVPAERLEHRIDVQDAEAESAVYERGRLRFAYLSDRRTDGPRSLRRPLLRHDANTCVSARAAEALRVALAQQRLLDQDADLGVPSLHEQLRPEDRFVGQRALWKREGPLAQPVL